MKKSWPLEIPDEVLDALKRALEPQPLITLLNHYKGVAIASEAFLQGYNLKTATLRIHPHQAVCLALEHQTCIQSRALSLAVQARVAAVEVGRGLARLTDFRQVAYTTERRFSVQPDPAHPFEVELLGQDWTAHSRLETISLAGMNIHLPATEIFFEPEPVFREGARLRARLQLPGAEQPIEAPGSVVRGVPQGDDYTVSIQLAADTQAQKAIREYILRRRAVVAQELQSLYEQMTQASAQDPQQ
jgi:hypothetical protein